jgi:hypothetical protein
MSWWTSRVQPASVAAAVTGCAALTATILMKPPAYPPYKWSAEADAFPAHIRSGLGPFQYYCSETGATTPVDRIPENLRDTITDISMMHRLKPGIDCGGDRLPLLASGVIATTPDSYEKIDKSVLESLRVRFGRSDKKLHKKPSTPHTHPVTVSVRRNLESFPFSSAISFVERRDVEKKVVDALSHHPGQYYPLPGSESSQSLSMSSTLLHALRLAGMVFEAPWAVYDLATGMGRHWPDARGVWVASSGGVVVWVNHEDHIDVVGSEYTEMEGVVTELEKNLKFAKSNEGYSTMKPEKGGNTVTVTASLITLPFLKSHSKFEKIWNRLPLAAILVENPATYNLVSTERFGGISSSESVQRARAFIDEIMAIESLLKSPRTTTEANSRLDALLS